LRKAENMSTRRIGELRDYVCRQCGLFVMLDVTGFDSDYNEQSALLYDILDDSDGCRRGDQIVCECGCDTFDVRFTGPPLFGSLQ